MLRYQYLKFYSIFQIPELREEIGKLTNSKNETTVFDIGCGIPTFSFELRNLFGVKKIVGIDRIKTFIELLGFNKNPLFYNAETIHDCYRCHVRLLMNQSEITSLKGAEFIDSFENDVKLFLGESIEDFNLKRIDNIDIVLALNIFHFVKFDSARRRIKDLICKLEESGLLIIEVNHLDNSSFTNPVYTTKLDEGVYEHNKIKQRVYLYDDNRIENLINEIEALGIKRLFDPIKIINESENVNSVFFCGKKSVVLV